MLNLENRKTRKKAKFINGEIVHVDVIIPNENDKKCLTEDEKKALIEKVKIMLTNLVENHKIIKRPFARRRRLTLFVDNSTLAPDYKPCFNTKNLLNAS